jgi:hypothetical protein
MILPPFIVRILQKCGVNQAIVYFLSSKTFSFVAIPITLFLIARLLSPSEQGYYYTFSSLLAISILFELGLGVVITQFASHEFAYLSWTLRGQLQGDVHHLARVLSLLRKSLQWYACICGIAVLVLLPYGIYFFESNRAKAPVDYIGPWVLLVVFFGIGTSFIPLTSVLEGCGRIVEVQKMRFLQSISSIFSIWIILISGGKLYAAAFEFVAGVTTLGILLFIKCRPLLIQAFRQRDDKDHQIRWFREVFPMQWRIAVSWLCAYISNYLFVPLLFTYRGAVVAGQMGMSLKISGLVYLLSMAWINTRSPKFGSLIQQGQIQKLEKESFKCSFQAVVVGFVLSAFACMCLFCIAYFQPTYSQRTLHPMIVSLLCLGSVTGVIMSAIGGYLRAYKQEPLMWISIVLGLVISAIAYVSARFFNASAMAVMLFFANLLIGVPLHVFMLHTKRREWCIQRNA